MNDLELMNNMALTMNGLEQCMPPIGKGMFPFVFVAKSYGEKVSLGQMAKSLRISLARCSNLAKRLEEEGLITRANDPSDKRICYVEVTEAGGEFCKQCCAQWSAFIDDYRAFIGEENFEMLREVFRLTRDFLKKRSEEGKGEAHA